MSDAVDELLHFRCQVWLPGKTVAVQCLAPSAGDAAYVVGQKLLREARVPWVRVIVGQWFTALADFVEPPAAIAVSPDDPQPAGAPRVVQLAGGLRR